MCCFKTRLFQKLLTTTLVCVFCLLHQNAKAISLNDSVKLSLNLSNRNPEYAEFIVDKLLNHLDSAQHITQIAELYRVKGLIAFYKVDYTKALNCFIKSKNLYELANDSIGLAKAINNVSLIYSEQEMYEKSHMLLEQVLSIRLKINDTSNFAGTYNNIGSSYSSLRNIEKAIEYFKKGVTTAIKYQNLNDLTMYYYNVGGQYLSVNNFDSAYAYFQRSLSNALQQNHKQYLANIYRYFGEFYIQKKEYQKAITYLNTSMQYARETSIVYEIQDAARYLHKAYAALGDYKNAYYNYQIFAELKDSANNIQTIKRIAQIETEAKIKKEHEVQKLAQEKKDIENKLALNKQKAQRNLAIFSLIMLGIVIIIFYWAYKRKVEANFLLEQQNEEIIAQKEETEAQRDRIKLLNETKDKFMAIIAHDLRNPLGGISQLSAILKEEIDKPKSEKAKLYVEQIHKSSKKAFNLLDNLLQWATVQVGSITVNPEAVNLNTLINDNIDLYKTNLHQKNIEVNTFNNNKADAYIDPQMGNTIIRNLLNNAIKFTPNNGKINISIEAQEHHYQISIKDTGIGIHEKDLPFLFDSGENSRKIGNSREKGTGLGLILCKEFVQRNCGKIWAESSFGKGSEFFVTFPKHTSN